ncbi:50S ribosomal protein L23 [Acanthopleuribacter pedis]|uniref:Large ribosomal subunit protein uL23 n=1 Tax=Acanthopleuribacter pedis TaxID=442870 RepID=A0A8J7QB45_9BACT|nr:50S ribosomal protein L23 [Acanthopleuribacter pedis]MBO1322276.1 50S ribosomal protein L23 [Acanthopleuribacter pedis]
MSERLTRILQAPHLTEKSMAEKSKDNVYVFRVRPDANKIEIKAAVEKHFDVEVTDVRTSNVKPKKRRVGRHIGKTAAWKKAYVTVKPGSGEIEYFEGT